MASLLCVLFFGSLASDLTTAWVVWCNIFVIVSVGVKKVEEMGHAFRILGSSSSRLEMGFIMMMLST